jgi:phage shock protein A
MKNLGSWVRCVMVTACLLCLIRDVQNHARYADLSYSAARQSREETRRELSSLEYQIQQMRREIRQLSTQNR